MPTLLCSRIAELDEWALSAPKSKDGQMSISSIIGKDGWPSVQFLPRDRLGEIYTVFEPSVFRGDGKEPRKGILFAAPPDVLASIRAIETWARQIAPAVVWHSAIKEPGTFSGSVKAKINVSGPNACRILDMSGKPAKWPENWVRLSCIPIVEFRGVYSQKTGSGLILDVTHLMIGEIESEPAKPCEFL